MQAAGSVPINLGEKGEHWHKIRSIIGSVTGRSWKPGARGWMKEAASFQEKGSGWA